MASEPEPHRVPDLWFPHADLILRAEDTIFRVLSDVLAARSTVFREMAAFPQPAEPEGDTIDGAPVVRLHDSAAEVTVFLRAIFDSRCVFWLCYSFFLCRPSGFSFFMPPPSTAEFSTVVGILRLAHKYDVAYLFRRALSYLDQMYPHTLQELVDNSSGMTDYLVDFPDDVETDLIALQVVSEVGALWLLPAIYYSICGVPAAQLFAAGERWNALAISQQQNCLRAQVEFTKAAITTHQFIANLPVHHPENLHACRKVQLDAYSTLVSSHWSDTHRNLNPLSESVFDLLEEPDAELCVDCNKYAQSEYSTAQLAFWQRLPGIFGLPEWEELVEMRQAVMEDAV